MPKLPDDQIAQRLQEGRNYKHLYQELKAKYDSVKAENKELKQLLLDQAVHFEAIVETQAARITELETMVFGCKPKGGLPVKAKLPVSKQPRTNDSYRRPIPPASAITTEEHYGITDCHRCGHELTDKTEALRYEEDIVLAALSQDTPHKTVAKQVVEQGWCSRCGQMSSAKDLRGQVVILGPVVRSLIVYLVVQADQTYAQTRDLLWQLYRFSVTSGEITNILAKRREAYLPVYEELKQNVRAGPAHLDETSYPIQSEQGAGKAWTMASAVTEDVVYKLADSRGKGHAEALVGEHYQSVGITDRYSVYKHLFGDGLHQICWAHLQRTARDLTHLECLGKAKRKHVTRYYHALAAIYTSIRTYQTETFDQAARDYQASELLAQVTTLCQPSKLDPKKLTDLKAGILEYQNCLFLCLTVDGIPADNNKAERSLRKLVIKRKKSLGVKTSKGARTMEVLLSVCQSLYNHDSDTFLPALHALANAE
jgi:transposase